MKKNTMLLLFVTITAAAFSQERVAAVQKMYGGLGSVLVHKNGYGSEAGFQVVWKKNWTTALYYQSGEADPKNLPDDYEQGYTLVFPDPWPAVAFKMISITGGKAVDLGRRFWLTTEGGLSFVKAEKMTFRRQSSSGNILYTPSNYTTTTENGSAVGGVVWADLHWAILRFAGLSLGGFVQFNSLQTAPGIVTKLILGKMNIMSSN
jgi:hypothetical protein